MWLSAHLHVAHAGSLAEGGTHRHAAFDWWPLKWASRPFPAVRPLPTGLVGAACRNVREYLNQQRGVLQNMGLLAARFAEPHQIAFYEDGSRDGSREHLVRFCENYTASCAVLPTVSSASKLTAREHRIAHARNQLIEYAFRLKVKYLVQVDLDDVNARVDILGFRHVLQSKGWDVATANQRGWYYDRFALRTPQRDGWGGRDRRDALKAWGLGDELCNRIPVEHAPLVVQSAFGGLGIYRVSKIGACRYATQREKCADCEHVCFHRCMRDVNHAIVTIQPRMVNSGWDWREENGTAECEIFTPRYRALHNKGKLEAKKQRGLWGKN